jgi:hypothetical protein
MPSHQVYFWKEKSWLLGIFNSCIKSLLYYLQMPHIKSTYCSVRELMAQTVIYNQLWRWISRLPYEASVWTTLLRLPLTDRKSDVVRPADDDSAKAFRAMRKRSLKIIELDGWSAWRVENIIVIYLDGSKFFPPISHCLFLPAKLLMPRYSAHLFRWIRFCPISTNVLPIIQYFFNSILFGSNKGYQVCSPLPSFPHTDVYGSRKSRIPSYI